MPLEIAQPTAPYLPWKTFFHSFDPFTQGIPPKIHRTLWRQSGFMQGLIMGSYRFFGLIDADDKPTAILSKVAGSPDARADLMRDLLKAGYPEIMAHDLTTMTMPILQELIEKYNVGGATKKKAITFFLQAAKFAGLPLSTFIQVRNTGPRRRRGQQANGGEAIETSNAATQSPENVKTLELNSGGKMILTVSVDFLSLSESDRKFVFDMVDRLKGYTKIKATTGQSTGGTS
jgi:hypothetical protein